MSKISNFLSLSSASGSDELPIVDVTDTSADPGGTTKRITVTNLLAGLLSLAGGTLTGAVAPAVSTLTFVASGTTLVNAALGNVFALTLTASTTTLGAPSNPVDGQTIHVRVTQGTGGSFTLAYASAYDFGTTGAPTLTTTAGKVDVLTFQYSSALGKWMCLGSALGF